MGLCFLWCPFAVADTGTEEAVAGIATAGTVVKVVIVDMVVIVVPAGVPPGLAGAIVGTGCFHGYDGCAC